MISVLSGKRILITGGTGSLGTVLVRRLLTGEMGVPERVIVFSRDETKQHAMRLEYLHRDVATDDIIYKLSREILEFRIGDVRHYSSVLRAVRDVDIVVHAAAMKQVPTCEYFPAEAFATNVLGAQNLVRAVKENDIALDTVVGVSTDKACKPVNVMGMTKALQERILINANLGQRGTRFICVRYGNVLSSRGSVVPLFVEQIRRGGPVTVTLKEMTRFLLTLETAVDTIFAAVSHAQPGEIFVPQVRAARVVDIAHALMSDRRGPIAFIGIRPGEKIHEVLVSEDEVFRTVERDGYYVIKAILPELAGERHQAALRAEFCSRRVTLNVEQLRKLLEAVVQTS